MVDLGKYEEATLEGEITSVQEMTLRNYLEQRHGAKAAKIIEKFNEENLDRQHLVVMVQFDDSEVDWFCMLPKVQGYTKSNLKKVKDRNNLPNKTKNWVGKKVALKTDKQGFLRVAV